MNDDRDAPYAMDFGSFTGTTAYLLLGPLVWSVHLLAIYAPQPTLCAALAAGALDGTAIRLFVLAATAVAVLILAVALWRPARIRRLLRAAGRGETELRFQDRVMRLLCLLSIVAIAWEGATALLLSPCLQLR